MQHSGLSELSLLQTNTMPVSTASPRQTFESPFGAHLSSVNTEHVRDLETSTDSMYTLKVLRPSRKDLAPLLLAVAVLAIGLGCALLAYFLLKRNELSTAHTSLIKVRADSISAYEIALESVVQSVATANQLFSVTNSSIDRLTQFVPFMYALGHFPRFVWSVSYSKIIKKGTRLAFIAETRLRGGEFANFTIFGKDTKGAVIPVYDDQDHLVIMQSVPTAVHASILGYALTSDLYKNATFFKAVNTRATAATGAVTLGNRADGAIGSSLNIPIFDRGTGEATGMLNGAVVFSDLTRSCLNSILDDVDVVLFDADLSNGTSAQGFMYSTMLLGNSSQSTYADNKRSLDNALFYEQGTLVYADKTLLLVFIPKAQYFTRFDMADKWVALIVILAGSIVLLGGCVLIWLMLKFQKITEERRSNKEIMHTLKVSRENIAEKLSRVTKQEAKNRAVIDVVLDSVVVLEKNGRIVQSNPSFERLLGYGDKELEKGVMVSSLFPHLDREFFKQVKGECHHKTLANRNDFIKVPVDVYVRSLDTTSIESGSRESMTVPTATPNVLSDNFDGEETYIVVIREDKSTKENNGCSQ
jgi:CHASE1-domain containing sensor protein